VLPRTPVGMGIGAEVLVPPVSAPNEANAGALNRFP
jgi:hypothetical protein